MSESYEALVARVEASQAVKYAEARAAYESDPANAEKLQRARLEAESGTGWFHRNVVALNIELMIPWG